MTLTDEEIEEIKARAEAATPGPWKWWTSNSWNRLKRDDCGVTQNVAEPFVSRSDNHPGLSINEEDMAFIAHARTDIPALLSALEAEKKRADEAEALAERLKREAAQHAQEARTANATIAEAYQAVTGGAGEPGNWHGAEPIVAEITRLREENERYREGARRAHVVVVNTASSRIKELEAEVVKLRSAAENLLDRMIDTYKARNGRDVGIVGDDGEKCWIVHTDEIFALELALKPAAVTQGEQP